MIFAWDETNRDHIAIHGVSPDEAQFVVENAVPPFPDLLGEGKWRAWGATDDGRFLQVVYVLKTQDDVAFEAIDLVDWATLENRPDTQIVRIIHAMDLTPEMKRQMRRRRR